MAFGFQPRLYQPTAEDRYILEEEGDVTEISFILSGEWAIAFNTYMILEDPPDDKNPTLDPDDIAVPRDMTKQGHYIAQRRKKWEYFGDYYVLASKRSQFHYVALTQVQTFSLTKKFMFGTIF